MYRDDPEKSVVNVPVLGYTEMELILTRSQDRGHTWSPIERDRRRRSRARPSRSATRSRSCATAAGSGRARPGWAGTATRPNGMNAILLVSEDQGRTWPSYITEFDRWAERHHPLGAALPRARRRPLADGRLGGRPRHGQDAADAVRHQPRPGRDLEARPDRLPGPDDQDHRAARRPDPRRLPAQRRARPVGDHRPRRRRRVDQRGDRRAVARSGRPG